MGLRLEHWPLGLQLWDLRVQLSRVLLQLWPDGL